MAEVECLRIQQDEFKVLSYIYLDQFTVLKESSPYKFTILCRPYITSQQHEFQMTLQFQFPKTYPKTPLKYEIQPITGITRDNLQDITKKIQDIIYDNRDKPIVYQIVEEVRLWIFEYLIEGKAYDEEQAPKKKIVEVFQRPKFNAFTPVTLETFTAWKKQFDLKHAKVEKVFKKQNGQEKVSGKEWFLGKGQDIEESQQDSDEDEDSEEEEEKEEVPRQHEYAENKLFVME